MDILSFYQVDAFTNEVLKGNPASVVPLDAWLPDDVLLNMAKEHNQSETAYFIPIGDGNHDYELRWFTPVLEVDLCGHATLASSWVIFNKLGFKGDVITFKTRFKGDLRVRRDGDWLELDFPNQTPVVQAAPADLVKAMNFPVPPTATLRSPRDWYFIFDDADVVKNLKPNFGALAVRDDWSCVSAPGKDCDFVSRFFTAPDGINEDPVTGSTHCSLVPYWAERLGKTQMLARQISARGGVLKVQLAGDRVKIAGQAVLYSEGNIHWTAA